MDDNSLSAMKTITFIVPVYNERDTLLGILKKIEETDLGLDKEIIIVDDCSTDGTRELIEGLEDRFVKLYHAKNQGKGAAIRTAIKDATGDLVIVQDADLEYDPEDIKAMLVPVFKSGADVVFGSRFLHAGPSRALFFWHMMGNKFLTLLTNMVSNVNLTDMETCYKLFKRDIIKDIVIEENRFGFEPEITIKLCQRRVVLYEVGISYHGRTYDEGKKIGWRDGVHALRCIFKYGVMRRFISLVW
ncbi:MAG: glycosyltransferase family 2 protein [Candidatus Magnetominusculus sp. LBB02]|nr:glycosyltransferase family 2 protein [Candidatus Magnetominusculus sp. LBB02]